MAKRCQSPSSINTYKQCPRKYYYQYILRLKTSPSIHTVRGNVVHSVLEDFFDLSLKGLSKDNFQQFFHQQSTRLLVHHWRDAEPKLEQLDLDQHELTHYFEESNLMLINWVNKLSQKIIEHPQDDLQKAFSDLTPIREKHYRSDEHWVQGYIDAIEEIDGKIRVMDYKTSKRFHLSDEYRLQLAIYALLYQEEHGRIPDEVGIYFLKDTGRLEHTLPADPSMVEVARSEIEVVHMNTESETINDYPKKEGPLCKWRTGQCDFYDACFKQKSLSEYPKRVQLPISAAMPNGTSTK